MVVRCRSFERRDVLDVVGDYRRVLDRNDIDAVLTSAPPRLRGKACPVTSMTSVTSAIDHRPVQSFERRAFSLTSVPP